MEDCGGQARLDDIRARFGDIVAEIVEECSDTDVVPKPSWRERKERDLAHVAQASDSVRLVIAADKLANVRSLISEYRRRGETIWERFRGGEGGALWYHRAMTNVLRNAGETALTEDLEREVSALDRLVVPHQV